MAILPNPECSSKFILDRTSVNNFIPLYDSSLVLSRDCFFDNTRLTIKGTKHDSTNGWELSQPLGEFKDNDHTGSFVKAGCFPQFKKRLGNTSYGPGIYTLNISSNKLTLKEGSTEKFALRARNFKDGVLPDRLFVLMQAGGGGGGSASGGSYIVIVPVPAVGSDGGSGASGAYFAIVINTALLKASSSNSYTFVVGGGGSGGTHSWSGTVYPGGSGGAGGDSYIQYNELWWRNWRRCSRR